MGNEKADVKVKVDLMVDGKQGKGKGKGKGRVYNPWPPNW